MMIDKEQKKKRKIKKEIEEIRKMTEEIQKRIIELFMKNVYGKKSDTSKSNPKHAGKEVGPGSDKQSDDELNEYIRSNAETAYHPCGTCKMGTDNASVVDENLKVRGIQNLRIVDASVMPEIPSANLNAPTLMIAEKASDLILNG